ncbi:HEAT repeat domain-containing protein [Chitinophaga flava]|uniref:HEAT repeat domain-containing protein n=1 Tax=Chitinophaga flava TaxID=2259036 RepID=A0A365XX35_9BACT|nr:hypothetical protein [Chitinophaga flava]RBL90628.1 hypothetical protein DF182_29690 [Chitinophaga flava]
MGIIEQLASSLGRRDEVPNQELAAAIAGGKDSGAVKELVALLQHKDKNIQHDSIKVLYEIGAVQPAMIAPYAKDFIALLDSRNNRMQWGAMTALQTITMEQPAQIYDSLGKLSAIADKGSVITKDNYMSILVKLYSVKAYAEAVYPLFNEQLLQSPVNQLPMYAELMQPCIQTPHKTLFRQTLTTRLPDIEKESKRKRVEKVLKKTEK